MAADSHSNNTTGHPISHANEKMISTATLPLTLSAAESRHSTGPGQHTLLGSAPAPLYTQYDLEVVDNDSMTTPTPSYTESDQGVTVGDSKIQSHTCGPPYLSLHHGLHPNPDDDSGSPFVGAPEEPGSLQLTLPSGPKLRHAYRDNGPTGRDKLSLVLQPVPMYCATTCTPVSKQLNYHVNSDNDVYRWRTTEGCIPIGIDGQSFESQEQGFLVEKCLKIVLRQLNDKNIGPQFRFVNDPCDSAFYITFRGDDPQCYASSFFPGSDPKDWYICVFKLALTLSSAQEQFLKGTSCGDIVAARSQAMEKNLIRILAHEMLHIVGVRHCVVDLNHERESYVRFPPDLSDDDNWDPLMKPTLDWEDIYHRFTWKPQTIDEIRQIYAASEGETIEYHRIRDVSWRDGAKKRKKIAKMNARCCIPKRRKNSWS